MSNKLYNIAIVGATGLVGTKFIQILEEYNLPINNLYLFASSRSAGKKLKFNNKEYIVEELNDENIKKNIDIALFSAGAKISEIFAPKFKDLGAIVVDNSSQFRMDPEVPLVIPEVNPEDAFKNKGIIANPNCSTTQCMLPLKVLYDNYGITRVEYSTYQAVSGSGVNGINDLEKTLRGEKPTNYPYPIANNCLPHIDVFLENGYTKEEMKMVNETHKIMNDDTIKVTATCVRVPIFFSHAVNMTVTLKNDFDVEIVKKQMSSFPGIILKDDIDNLIYPLNTEATGSDEVYVGRIRRDISTEKTIHVWCVSDNTRKGAASNTVQIAKLLIENGDGYNV